MSGIKVLDEDTINKIAAGEVIERPFSVVKELVENSIDAGATSILIEVEDGGKSLIGVVDDGCGIDREDLPLAFERHATSKIRAAEDLDYISTLGFRGEALSAIASVSRSVEVLTKTRDASSGSFQRIENGNMERGEAGSPLGTKVVVSGLFHNLPARRKHLRSAGWELARIAELVTELAIINHGISFELFSKKRTIFKSARSPSWDDVLARTLGFDVFKCLLPLEAEAAGFRIKGMVGSHLLTRSSPDWVLIYVNGRPVSSRPIQAALREAYRGLIPRSKSPIAIISIEIDPRWIDVNVHPTKREVRFLREEEVIEAVRSIVSSVLKRSPSAAPEDRLRPLEWREPSGLGRELDMAFIEMEDDIHPHGEQSTLPLEGLDDRLEATLPGQRILGQIMDLYIVAEGNGGLLLVDQHAAAERISYEAISRRIEESHISQELIAPVAIELSSKEQVLLETYKPLLVEMGFSIQPFGGRAHQVRAVPATGSRLESPQAIHDLLLDLFALGKASKGSTIREEAIKLLACRGSIKAGEKLSIGDMRKLLHDLLSCNNPLTCPHGRPTMITVSAEQLEKIFNRR
ncbi:MAG: DNA mismatch repair endonuclease MutL [Methanotrichaceae archaeon]|nr:DNA mismatch repair endonuclease MutL [Methanotrichaceae archaeon]